jgi:hypothetical protein
MHYKPYPKEGLQMDPNDSRTRPGLAVGRRGPRPCVVPFALWCQVLDLAGTVVVRNCLSQQGCLREIARSPPFKRCSPSLRCPTLVLHRSWSTDTNLAWPSSSPSTIVLVLLTCTPQADRHVCTHITHASGSPRLNPSRYPLTIAYHQTKPQRTNQPCVRILFTIWALSFEISHLWHQYLCGNKSWHIYYVSILALKSGVTTVMVRRMNFDR